MSTPSPNTNRLQQSLEAVARGRYVMPMVLVFGVLAIVVNESTYTHSHSTLTNGIALTDARMQATETLQLLTTGHGRFCPHKRGAGCRHQRPKPCPA